MLWICWGQFWAFLGIYIPFLDDLDSTLSRQGHNPYQLLWSGLGFVLILAAPAVGGFVVVGQMLKAYGNCVRLY
jgi:hypothetical protein